MGVSIQDDVVDNGLELSTLVEEETRVVITDLFNQAEDQVTSVHKIGTVEVDGHSINKSALVSQLNDNVYLFKYRLARIRHSIQFNNHDLCLQTRSSCGSTL